MSPALRDFLILLLLIGANGVFALAEMALVSARKIRLEQIAAKSPGGKAALELSESPQRFLSTVQIGITMIGVIAGVFGGTRLAGYLEPVLAQIAALEPYADTISLVLVVVITTYLSLVIGELVPKRIALAAPETMAALLARPMRFLATLAYPAVWLLSVSTEGILALIPGRQSSSPEVNAEEIQILIKRGAQSGLLEAAESKILAEVFRLGDRRVYTLMTPRSEIVWLDLEDSWEENRARILAEQHTRFPVGRGSLENLLGIIQVRDILSRLWGESDSLEQVLREPLFVPESTRAIKVLELFKSHGTELAIVVDEYGGIQGLITLHDILEALVGEIPGESPEEPLAHQREDGSWLLDGRFAIEDLAEILPVNELPVEDGYYTLGGLVMDQLGRIPEEGDGFTWCGLVFEVVDMAGNRVDKVLVRPLTTETEP
jgi:putative hemolysin